MTDREMLELAAKAAGEDVFDLGGALMRNLPRSARGPQYVAGWNPLKDDGDRYRLLAKLKMSVDFNDCTVWKRMPDGSRDVLEYWGGDGGDEAHAIVRAAAAIGAAAPTTGD